MKKINVSNILGGSVAMPIKAGSLEHLQNAYQEAIQQLILSHFGIANNSSVVQVLQGLVVTGSNTVGQPFATTAGIVYYQGELFAVPAFSTAGVVTTIIGTITTTYYTANDAGGFAKADPVLFTDGVSRNIHQIRTIVLSDGTSGTGTADFDDFVNPEQPYPLGISSGMLTPVGGGSLSSVSGGIYVRRVGRILFFQTSNFAVTITGTVSEIIIDLSGLGYPIVTLSSSSKGTRKVGSSYKGLSFFVSGGGGLTGTIIPDIDAAFATGANTFYLSGMLYI